MSVVFQEYEGTVVGIGDRGRTWRVRRSPSGWRLEFRDAGDYATTYAGTFRSLDAAMDEARRG